MIRYSRFKPILFGVVFLAFGAGRALAQQPTLEDAVRRIAALEERIAQLEQKVRQPKALPAAPQQAGNPLEAGAPKWKVLVNWRRLKRGMSMAEVTGLLGEAKKVEAGPFTYWYWGDLGREGNVIFDPSNKVYGWSEPRG